jgi:TRAP-type mannitol/chloroaromatic compound transport system substrate-binding protein
VLRGMSLGESLQPKALAELTSKGVNLVTWGPEFLKAFEKAWDEVAAELAAKSPEFKKAWDSNSKYRKEYAKCKDRGYLQ